MQHTALPVPAEIRRMIDAGALVVLNHSGGKDSQAMTALVRLMVPAEQIVVIHAHLSEVEWDGTEEHARANSQDLEFRRVQAVKTFFEMVEHRGMFPSPQYRQCTSDLKRGPIDKEIRRICRERGLSLVVNCLGERAQESARRARKAITKTNLKLSKAGRTVRDWLPIHGLSKRQVFQVIADAGQLPHWAYLAGMTRLSCRFCIMASQGDLTTAAGLDPQGYGRYVATEKRLDFTLSPSMKPLEAITGIAADAPRDPTGLVSRALQAEARHPERASLAVAALFTIAAHHGRLARAA